MNSEFRIALTTVSNQEEASSLSKALIEQKLASCVNSIKIENSCYFWDGTINNSPEILVSIKTKLDLITKIKSLLDTTHPYQTYFFTVIKPESINQAYFDWLLTNTKE